ncbi:MAG: substrate-binding domain-containing protein [Firmicutes bacterium]|nr:substrate-binding domain-containing protein [Alicyclobacillaceae bacterium]MCL6498016.1 substrate-binding domain-containing protein [Bacillota bacterium]
MTGWRWAVVWAMGLVGGLLARIPARTHWLVMGATSVFPYVKASVATWAKTHPGYAVAVTGGGSWAGLAALDRGHADIGVSDLPPELWRPARPLLRIPLGAMPILFVAHRGIGVGCLDRSQLQAVFHGTVSNWRTLGGRAEPVTVVVRPPGSGAREVVRRYLGESGAGPRLVTQLSNGAVLAVVATTPGAIGYVEGPRTVPGVVTLCVDGQRWSPAKAQAWPLQAIPSLYLDPSRLGDPAFRSLVQWLATDPARLTFGLFPLQPGGGGE